MNFTVTNPARLTQTAIDRAAASLGVEAATLEAVLDVETGGSGIDHGGRVKMLFEPHILYRNLSGRAQEAAVQQGLAYPHWGMHPYPADSYPRLEAAIRIDEGAALSSCSWGLGQIMGSNFRAIGHMTVQEMVEYASASEDHQLDQFVAFIRHEKLEDELQHHDWEGFARIYNGPGYARNNYHGKLALRFNFHNSVKGSAVPPKVVSEADLLNQRQLDLRGL